MTEKLSGKTVLVDGELVPIETILEGRETDKQRQERHELVEKEKAERNKELPDFKIQMANAAREAKELKRVKFAELLKKHNIPFDGNLDHDGILDLAKEHELVDEEGVTTIKGAQDVEKKDSTITVAEAKLRSSIQASIMDEDIDVDLNAETEVLQAAWQKFLEEKANAKSKPNADDESGEEEPTPEIEGEGEVNGLEQDLGRGSEVPDSEEEPEEVDEDSKEEVLKKLEKEEKKKLIASIKEIGTDEKPTMAWGLPKLEKLLKKLKTPAL